MTQVAPVQSAPKQWKQLNWYHFDVVIKLSPFFDHRSINSIQSIFCANGIKFDRSNEYQWSKSTPLSQPKVDNEREKKNYVIESIHGSLDLNAFLWCSDYVVTEWFVYYCRDQCVYCQNVWNNDGKMLKKQLKSIHPEKSDIIYGCMAFILMLIKIYWWLQQRPQFHFNSHVALCMWIRVNVFFDGCLLILLILLFI